MKKTTLIPLYPKTRKFSQRNGVNREGSSRQNANQTNTHKGAVTIE
jgi:hypothetical protein